MPGGTHGQAPVQQAPVQQGPVHESSAADTDDQPIKLQADEFF